LLRILNGGFVLPPYLFQDTRPDRPIFGTADFAAPQIFKKNFV